MSLLPSGAIESAGYDINNSLRLRSSASAYLNRTPASAGNRTTWTWSGWVKRGKIDSGASQYFLFSAYTAASDAGYTAIFISADTLRLSGHNTTYRTTTQVFRDPSAWYHLVVVWDTTQGTASNRIKMYINGSQVTAFATSNDPTSSQTSGVNAAGAHTIGANSNTLGTSPFDGYLADVNFIDGSAKTPSDFGETDATTGVWKPKAYTGTYGTNGFYLKFSDIATTSGSNAGLGKDFSGNTNYWTTNNISVTSGTTYDAMKDSPTLTSATVANYATFSGTNLGTYANSTITEAGLKVSVSAGGTPDGGKAYAPFGMSDGSGKWYFEMTCVDPGSTNQRLCFGVANVTTNPNAVAITNGYYASASGAHGNYNIGTFTTNDVLQVAYDATTNKLWFGKNGTWYNSGNPATGTTPLVTVTSGITYVPFSTYASSGGGPGIGAWNFGQRPFSYTPPTGFVALNTYNLPTSTIVKGNTVMDAQLWTGDGVNNRAISQYSFYPDFTWIKTRSSAYWHVLADSVRGANKALFSNSTSAESTNDVNGYTSAFSSTGFTLTSGSTSINDVNQSGQTYVGWCWNAGSNTTSSNTSGTITSTVSVNTTAGFSIVTYTGTGANATVGHGLGVAPKMLIVKNRASATNWKAWQTSLAGTEYLELNNTNGKQTATTPWNSTIPTSTVFSIGTSGDVNTNGTNYVAYCWAEIAGFSKFGSYTGNGSTDGPFIYLGFRPKYVLIKRTDTTQSWITEDSVRDGYNCNSAWLYPNLSNAEDVAARVDFLSNGFKLRNSTSGGNDSGGTFIYAAFAENPTKHALAR